MTDFETIINRARELHGGACELEYRLPDARSTAELKTKTDAYYLSNMSRRIFRAGLRHKMVDDKWPVFHEVFHRFNIDKVRLMSDDDLDKLMQDKRIIRHWGKIKAVRANAETMSQLKQEYASVGEYIGNWPNERLVELWDDLKKRFSQLGGVSGPSFLRMVERDTFILTNDVLNALNHWGVYHGSGKNKKDRQIIQQAFNQWAKESRRPFCQISIALALSLK